MRELIIQADVRLAPGIQDTGVAGTIVLGLNYSWQPSRHPEPLIFGVWDSKISTYFYFGSLYITEENISFFPQNKYIIASLWKHLNRSSLNCWGREGGKRLQMERHCCSFLTSQGRASRERPRHLVSCGIFHLTRRYWRDLNLLPPRPSHSFCLEETLKLREPSTAGSTSTLGTGISSQPKPMGLGSSKGLPAGLCTYTAAATSPLKFI